MASVVVGVIDGSANALFMLMEQQLPQLIFSSGDATSTSGTLWLTTSATYHSMDWRHIASSELYNWVGDVAVLSDFTPLELSCSAADVLQNCKNDSNKLRSRQINDYYYHLFNEKS